MHSNLNRMSKKGFSKTLSILFIELCCLKPISCIWHCHNWVWVVASKLAIQKIPQKQQVSCKQHWTLSDTNQYHVHFFNTFMLAMPMKKRIPNTGELGLTQIKVASSISRNFLIMWFPFGKKWTFGRPNKNVVPYYFLNKLQDFYWNSLVSTRLPFGRYSCCENWISGNEFYNSWFWTFFPATLVLDLN